MMVTAMNIRHRLHESRTLFKDLTPQRSRDFGEHGSY